MTKNPNAWKSIALAGVLSTMVLPANATTYRWVDSSGRVHYSDTIPPQQAGMGHEELDTQGRVVKEVERTYRTPEEQRLAEEARRRAELERRKELDQLRRDRALLSSYTTEAEIDLVRDRALELEKLQINSLQAQMNDASEKLTYANGEIKKRSGPGQTVPRSFLQIRDEAQNELARIGEMLRDRQGNLDAIRAKYEADKQRFRELKGMKP
jgi:hypothetical protein